MDEYIDRQAAIEALNKELEGINEVLTSSTLPYHDKERQRQRKGQVKEDIRAIESVPSADVAPVVRCKDCEVLQICRFAQGLGLDGYCSQGERMDGEGN